ncbi:hut operon positive regulator [Peribacillus deserti]|uniref:Hut operon positive regulatory protein n=1 Tax=Peribacillus deserti TaxID=673318 RepID=A0ABS2QJN2_9BACI|nr:hut operon transcriptional regulator HutP [Peribacillus deserti]MBM7693351.1 hut operon positive regulator [Peribacillus deserti]
MLQIKRNRIGLNAILLASTEAEEENKLYRQLRESGYIFCSGKVGSMDTHKIVAAIETAAKRNEVVDGSLYREVHALYHSSIEAVQGMTRGQAQIGELLRTVGLRFAVLRGKPFQNPEEGEWIAVALYGTIGAPIKGFEHETVGLGINHI